MDQFGELFTAPESPRHHSDLRQSILQILQQIRTMDHDLEMERRHIRTQHFMSLLNDAESGNVSVAGDQEGATGQGPPPSNQPPENPVNSANNLANVNIVNEYNSFNLANVTTLVTPKWKTSESLLDDFRKFKHSYQRIFDSPMCHITIGKVKTNMFLIWAGPDGEDILNLQKSINTQESQLTPSTTGF